MFETGMSALVLKICSEYAKSLGLNFPPCTQQEINAICQWVDKHTIKDMTISQNGYDVTFTFKTENDTTKEFTFTIPKKVDIDELEKVLKGSDSIVVDRLVDNSGLQVSLAQSVVNNINSKLTKPTNPSAESAVTMLADGTVGTKPLSEIGGKLYRHSVKLNLVKPSENYLFYFLSFNIITSSNVKFTVLSVRVPEIYQAYLCTAGVGNDGATDFAIGSFDAEYNPGTEKWTYVVYKYNPMGSSERFEFTSLEDTVTEV